jgi:hypothetical protein
MPRVAKQLVAARPKTHGNIEDVANTSQGIMGVLRRSPNWEGLSNVRKESILLIAHKLARIVSGNPDHADHWDDIGGYAELGKNNAQAPAEMPVAASLKRAARKVKKVAARPAKKSAKRRPATVAARPARPVKATKARRPPRVRRPAAEPAAPQEAA